MITRDFLAEIGFYKEQLTERPWIAKGIEVWFNPVTWSYVAFYDEGVAMDVWPDANSLTIADLVKKMIEDLVRENEEKIAEITAGEDW